MRLACLLLALPALVAAAPASDANRPERVGDPQDRMICKTFPVTGSLIATNKICLTKHEWDWKHSNLTQRDAIGTCAGPNAGPSGGSSFCGLGQ